MRFSFILPAGDNEVFAKDAFAKNIGRPIIVEGQPGVVHDAVVDENGKSVEFTIVVDAILWGDYQGDPANY